MPPETMPAPTCAAVEEDGGVGILYFAGGATRVQTAIDTARARPHATLFFGVGARVAEVLAIAAAVPNRLHVDGRATDTVGEAVFTSDAIRAAGVKQLYVITEPGHLDRAWRITRIIHPTIEVIPVPAPYAGYLSELRTTVTDCVRAWLFARFRLYRWRMVRRVT